MTSRIFRTLYGAIRQEAYRHNAKNEVAHGVNLGDEKQTKNCPLFVPKTIKKCPFSENVFQRHFTMLSRPDYA